ncbi:MAG TPA: SDR family oxidoreductase, partial [Gammaproteobacteria bacterium]|nr:SDR family oxidoreductase [Gammaproteobacteria bacterium]
GVQALGVAADLSMSDAPQHVFATALAHFRHIDILINTAAYCVNADIFALTADEIDRHYAVNVRAMLLLCQAFVRQHDGRSGGRIINFTSGQTLTPMPTELPYIATKSAIEGLTGSLARAVVSHHITVNTIDPGATDTGWIDAALREQLIQHAPLGRIGEPIDVAHLVRFLVSDQGQWMTGQVLHSRGGA